MSAVTAGSANLKPHEDPAFSGGSSWYVCVCECVCDAVLGFTLSLHVTNSTVLQEWGHGRPCLGRCCSSKWLLAAGNTPLIPF